MGGLEEALTDAHISLSKPMWTYLTNNHTLHCLLLLASLSPIQSLPIPTPPDPSSCCCCHC